MTTAPAAPHPSSHRGSSLSASDLPFDRLLTVDDWYALPEWSERYELYEGALILMPAPSLRHQDVVLAIGSSFFDHAIRSGGMASVAPTGVVLSPVIGFEPDVLYLSASRIGLRSERGIEGAPDIVVEVASPGTRRFDLSTKLPAYFRFGVLEVWIADPVRETISVYFADEPNAPLTVAFGEQIPSRLVDIGNAMLDRLPRFPGS